MPCCVLSQRLPPPAQPPLTHSPMYSHLTLRTPIECSQTTLPLSPSPHGTPTAYSLPMGLPEQRTKAKNRALRKLIHDYNVVAVQETHGQREHWNTIKHQFAKSHKIFYSCDPDSPNKAGVALVIKLKICRQSFREEILEVTPGRDITVRLYL